MDSKNKYNKLFSNKSVIGMIHLSGITENEIIQRALNELEIYTQEGVDGAIVEDYHGPAECIWKVLKEVQKSNFNILLGVNNLGNPYSSFHSKSLGVKFIQFDSVQTQDLHLEIYNLSREKYSDMIVLGGVGFKYTKPTGNSLEKDLEGGMSRCDAIVTTGTGTGIETPMEKLIEYKKILKDFPLIVGAGVDVKNVYEQLQIADGAIVGSSFKPNKNTRFPVDRYLVRELINIVMDIRKNIKK